MSIISLSIAIAVIVAIRALISHYVFRRYPGFVKWVGYYVLALVTGIFVFFPTCILLGNKFCWDVEVSTQKTGLLVASTIILLLCAWVWYKIIEDPKMKTSSGKPVATLIIVLTVIVGLLILYFVTSPYWASLVGH
jgi:dipeptide/tripeptide permease